MRSQRNAIAALSLFVGLIAAAISSTPLRAQDQSGVFDDYNQWKQALGAAGAADAVKIASLPDYQVELVRAAKKGEGSWVSLTFDPKGRIIIAREDQGLLRLTLPAKEGEEQKIETINNTLHECRGLLWAYDSLYANANNDLSFVRLRDLDGDDQFEEVTVLRKTPGDVGHGRNDLVLGPDGHIYLIYGNDTRLPEDYDPTGSPFRNYAIDRPVPTPWNRHLFNWGVGPLGGHVIRTDRDGKKWEVICGGFRNAFGIDFNSDGEMFTFDADMEWDIGLPCYRPCRVNHIVSAADFGWRQGNDKWPAWYPDSLPTTVDIGLASPTAVKFGYKSHFPPPMKNAFFILDWAYGRILAVHLTPQGSTYSARFETFLRGRPLNVTDIEFGPDGAMYFITGGRGTQSGLYRVKYVGPEVAEAALTPEEEAAHAAAKEARELRRSLEAFHVKVDPAAVDAAWPHLSSSDLWLRHAARVAIEFQPIAAWQDRAFTETNLTAALTALMAAARVGGDDLQPRVVDRLIELAPQTQTPEHRILLLRSAVISCARHAAPAAERAARLAAATAAMLPDAAREVNEIAIELLATLGAPELPKLGMSLLASAKTQEERIHYLEMLRLQKDGWTPELRRGYFRALSEANHFQGAQSLPRVIDFIKADALATAPEADRPAFAALIERKPPETLNISQRPFFRHWEMDDLEGSLDNLNSGRDLKRGREMFHVALCIRCHRLGGEGATFGPDLSAVGSRFGRRDLLEAILVPSKVIDDKYRATLIETSDGRTIAGLIVGGDAESVYVASNALDPTQVEKVKKADIEAQQPSLVSPMPTGLVDTLTKEELLDLLAYLESTAQPQPPPGAAGGN